MLGADAALLAQGVHVQFRVVHVLFDDACNVEQEFLVARQFVGFARLLNEPHAQLAGQILVVAQQFLLLLLGLCKQLGALGLCLPQPLALLHIEINAIEYGGQ